MKKILAAIFLLGLSFSILSGRILAQADPLSASSAAAVGSRRITLDLKGIEITEALKILSTEGNMDLVIGGDIKGRVTLFLKDVDIQDAFDIILLSNNLAYDRRGKIIRVMTQNEYEQVYGERFGDNKDVRIIHLSFTKASEVAKTLSQARTKVGRVIVDELSNSVILMDSPAALDEMQEITESLDRPMVTKIFELRYAVAKDVKDKIAEIVTKDLGSVRIDERTNNLVVTDVESKMPKIEEVITSFDAKPRQVLIDAKIVSVSLDDKHQLGIDWDGVFDALHREFKFTNRFRITTPGSLNPGIEARIGTLGGTNFAMVVQALKSVGDTNVLSSPRITAINNQEAKILVGENRPYAVNTVVQTTGSTTTASQLSFIEVGIKLHVTPTINQDGFVTMKIKPETSAVSGTYTYGDPSTTVPIVSTTQAETSVTVKDGRTIIIAGLIKDERSGSVNKIPGFGDLPIFGNLFRKLDNRIQKQELVIFLTPHIITGERDYMEVPKIRIPEERSFTMSEQNTFERRNRLNENPGIFKELRGKEEPPAAETAYTKEAVPASVEEYYYLVKNRVLENLRLPKKARKAAANIKLSFILSSDGSLSSEPQILESTDGALNAAVVVAVKKASPFPAFPPALAQGEKTFILDFVFE